MIVEKKEKLKNFNYSFDSQLVKGVFFTVALIILFAFGVYCYEQDKEIGMEYASINTAPNTNWSVYENKDYNFEIRSPQKIRVHESPGRGGDEEGVIEIELQ